MLLNLPRARRLMRENQLDALIATSPENVAYVADYHCLTHWLNKGTPVLAVLPSDDSTEPCLITLPLEISAWAEDPSWIEDVRLHGTSLTTIGVQVEEGELVEEDRVIAERCFRSATHPGWLEVLLDALAERGLAGARLGFDDSGLSVEQWRRVQGALPKAEVVPAADIFRRIRMVKTEAELARLRKSNEITEGALADLLEAVKPGANEADLVHLYETRVAELGGQPGLTLVTAGRRSGHAHALTADYVLQHGDVVKIDLGCSYRHYWSDTARMKVVGEPGPDVAAAYAAILAGEQAALNAIRPGVRPSELFEIAMGTVRDSGIADYRRHHVGHGIGIELYDHPLVQAAATESEISGLGQMNEPLEVGMVLNIECPYYVIGKWGMNVEDTVVVTPQGYEYLTRLPRELRV